MTGIILMNLIFSDSLKNQLSDNTKNIIKEEFLWWKSDKRNEFISEIFGKDSALITPKINGKPYVLRHCHLPPLNDKKALAKWKQCHRLGSRKVSDRVLIYAENNSDYYLIDILDDPGAHEIMKMKDVKGRSFMLKCAEEADIFLNK